MWNKPYESNKIFTWFTMDFDLSLEVVFSSLRQIPNIKLHYKKVAYNTL